MTEANEPESPKVVAVRAIKSGFFGGVRRRVGDVFEVPVETKGSWFTPTDPTLAEKHRIAIETASKAKKQAEDNAREAAVKVQIDANAAARQINVDLAASKAAADNEARIAVFGSMIGGSTQVAEPAKEDDNAGEGGDGGSDANEGGDLA